MLVAVYLKSVFWLELLRIQSSPKAGLPNPRPTAFLNEFIFRGWGYIVQVFTHFIALWFLWQPCLKATFHILFDYLEDKAIQKDKTGVYDVICSIVEKLFKVRI